jgi:TIR domain-containing protein/pentapeptide repeat protein
MDRDEALKLLRGGPEGIAIWNRWRESFHEFFGDLSFVDLSRADLRGADLRKTTLLATNLRIANLSGLNLNSAVLPIADLRGADLRDASLHGAHLMSVNFDKAKLKGADLSNAICSQTLFTGVDLSQVKGLDLIVHQAPSTVGVDTLFQSKGKIPETFLRRCGVPDALIKNLPSLIGSMEPIQFYSCFISHSSKDQPFADRLYSRMVQEKLRVWYAPADMRGGRKSIDQIDEAIRVHDKLLLVLSKASMASDWVLHEIRRAVERERLEKCRVLFPIGLASWKDIKAWTAFDSDSGKDLAKVVREYHIPAFSKWKDHDSFEAGFGRLLDDLKAVESTGTKPA